MLGRVPGIKHIAYYLPDATLESSAVAARFGFEIGFLHTKVGVERRHYAAPDQTSSDMAAEAMRRLLAETGEPADAIEALIVVTQTPDYAIPQMSGLVQDKAGLSKDLAGFDLSLGCSGYVYALSVADGLMRTQGLSKLAVVTVESYSKILDPGSRDTVSLLGDAATATLMTVDDPLYRVGKSTFGTDGTRGEAIICRGTGVVDGPRHGIEMDGRAVFSFVMSELPRSIGRCLEINRVAADDVSRWVFHQANRYLVENLALRLGLPMGRVPLDMSETGNTGSCSIPLVLRRKVLSRATRPSILCLSGFGVGASWASTLLFSTAR